MKRTSSKSIEECGMSNHLKESANFSIVYFIDGLLLLFELISFGFLNQMFLKIEKNFIKID